MVQSMKRGVTTMKSFFRRRRKGIGDGDWLYFLARLLPRRLTFQSTIPPTDTVSTMMMCCWDMVWVEGMSGEGDEKNQARELDVLVFLVALRHKKVGSEAQTHLSTTQMP